MKDEKLVYINCAYSLHLNTYEYYVYWTVHHLDRGIKIEQLDVTCFIVTLFNAQHVADINTAILRSLRLIVELFHNNNNIY